MLQEAEVKKGSAPGALPSRQATCSFVERDRQRLFRIDMGSDQQEKAPPETNPKRKAATRSFLKING